MKTLEEHELEVAMLRAWARWWVVDLISPKRWREGYQRDKWAFLPVLATVVLMVVILSIASVTTVPVWLGLVLVLSWIAVVMYGTWRALNEV